MLNNNAIFSDGTEDYRIPCEPKENETVTIRIRTGKNIVNQVYLMIENSRFNMVVNESDALFDYYEATYQLGKYRVDYYFEIHCEETVYFYNNEGLVSQLVADYNFVITPGFSTPKWAKGAVMYQIFVDRFYNGDPSNDVEDREYIYINDGTTKVNDWSKYPGVFGVREFYGGDLKGIYEKLDYIEELGIEVIYLNPIFASPSNHKYDTQDYDYVDPHYGMILEDGGETLPQGVNDNRKATKFIKRVTNEKNLEASNDYFIELVKEIHKRGMKVILDGVFNHCGSFNKWLDREGIYDESNNYEKGAYLDKNSPYHTFFKFNKDKWPNNPSYDGWWGYDTLPKLNYEGSKKLYEYVMKIAKKWVAPPFNCDGWRLDVAADLGFTEEFNHTFWKDFRKSVKEGNPEAIILAEHYGDPSDWLKGDEWDSVMNYDAFMEPLTWFLTGMEKHSDEFKGDMLNNSDAFFHLMKLNMSKYQTPSLQIAMNELSNHDHSRFLTRTNKTVGRIGDLGPKAAEEGINYGVMRMAVLVQMTWPGAPTIYYGDEAGVCGWTDPDNRRTYPWGYEKSELIEFHKYMIRIHKDYEVFRTGSIQFLTNAPGFISYGRFNRIDKFIIAVNNNQNEITVNINAWEIGIQDMDMLVQLMLTTEEGYYPDANLYYTKAGVLQITLPPTSSIIIKNVVQ
jgi:alpha-glucosidase